MSPSPMREVGCVDQMNLRLGYCRFCGKFGMLRQGKSHLPSRAGASISHQGQNGFSFIANFFWDAGLIIGSMLCVKFKKLLLPSPSHFMCSLQKMWRVLLPCRSRSGLGNMSDEAISLVQTSIFSDIVFFTSNFKYYRT